MFVVLIQVCNNVSSEDKECISDYVQLYGSNVSNDNNVSLTKSTFIIRKVIKEIEWLNDDGTFNWNSQESLYKRLQPPPIETVNHTGIIFLFLFL